MAVTHFAWVPDARMNGLVPALTIAAGVAHALARAITGRCLVDLITSDEKWAAQIPGLSLRLRRSEFERPSPRERPGSDIR